MQPARTRTPSTNVRCSASFAPLKVAPPNLVVAEVAPLRVAPVGTQHGLRRPPRPGRRGHRVERTTPARGAPRRRTPLGVVGRSGRAPLRAGDGALPAPTHAIFDIG